MSIEPVAGLKRRYAAGMRDEAVPAALLPSAEHPQFEPVIADSARLNLGKPADRSVIIVDLVEGVAGHCVRAESCEEFKEAAEDVIGRVESAELAQLVIPTPVEQPDVSRIDPGCPGPQIRGETDTLDDTWIFRDLQIGQAHPT